MAKRRYAKYTLEDVQRAIQQQQQQLQVVIAPGSASPNGRRIRLRSHRHRRDFWVILLARSSDWYRYNLNTYQHNIEAVVAATHDSCLSVPVLAMDTLEWTPPFETRYEESLAPAGAQSDVFDRFRRTRYGHAVLVGALIVGRKEAVARLMTLPASTRFRIEAEVKRLRHRRAGRPLRLWDDPA